MKEKLIKKVEGMIQRKIKELDYTPPKYQYKVQRDIDDLSDLYFAMEEMSEDDLLWMKMMDDKLSFVINKNFNLPKAVKKYADQVLENIRSMNENPELI